MKAIVTSLLCIASALLADPLYASECTGLTPKTLPEQVIKCILEIEKRPSSASIPSGAIPSGAVMAFDLASCPKGWGPMESAQGRTIIGVGKGSGLSPRHLGETKGDEWQTLTTSNLPSHVHSAGKLSGTATDSGGHDHKPASGALYLFEGIGGTAMMTAGGGNRGPANVNPGVAGVHSHSVAISGTTGDVGEGQKFGVMPPYLALLYCKKS